MRIHFDNINGWSGEEIKWCREDKLCGFERRFPRAGVDDYGPYFDIPARASHFTFQIAGGAENGGESPLYRYYGNLGPEVWVKRQCEEVYHVKPARAKGKITDVYDKVKDLFYPESFQDWTDVSGQGVKSMLGATPLQDGTCIFAYFHPRAAQVYLCGEFNGWQYPGREGAKPDGFLPMDLYEGFYGGPNIWLVRILWSGKFGDEYKFFVQGGIEPFQGMLPERLVADPYTKAYGGDQRGNNSRIITPHGYIWQDGGWRTPPIHDLFLYELSVYGMTQGIREIPESRQGTFQGLIQLIRMKYFENLGVTALALMPTSEAPSLQGPSALGYDPCGFVSIERDFGSPDDFRELVDTAHRHGLAVIVDQVFNHTSNVFNPVWGTIRDGSPGGFYFSGSTPWGNRVATEKDEVQNILIDACKIMLREYHVDGFRFDATNSVWMDHRFLYRLAHEIKDKGFKPDCILICENLPNEKDLNLDGYNGFAQWCDPFHDKIKALLREGVYQDWVRNDPGLLGDVFYFCKAVFAAHTNNVVNYCESHDENSVPFEVRTNPSLADGHQLEQKTKLALMATVTALGQPMIYMGQEFGVNRPRNMVLFDWPDNPEGNPFFRWAHKILSLRRLIPELRISGYNPQAEGKFAWVIGPWLERRRGGGAPVIGWRAGEVAGGGKQVLCLFNFGNAETSVDLPLPGRMWIKVADLNEVRPISAGAGAEKDALRPSDGTVAGFNLPAFSGFLYYKTGD
ncbi:MAG: alpha-amylase family glycosyl hydrolase [Bacillota bacterium]